MLSIVVTVNAVASITICARSETLAVTGKGKEGGAERRGEERIKVFGGCGMGLRGLGEGLGRGCEWAWIGGGEGMGWLAMKE